MHKELTSRMIYTGFIFLILLLAIFRTISILGLHDYECFFTNGGPPAQCVQINFYLELALYGLALLLLVYQMRQDGCSIAFFRHWRQNPALLAFILLIVLSSTWSIAPQQTLSKSFLFTCFTLCASYILWRSNQKEVFQIFFWFYLVFTLFTLLYITIKPANGIMWNRPYVGSWNGIFWHRNYLGSFMALGSAVFLIRFFLPHPDKKVPHLVLNIILYALSWLILIHSNSAGGLITAIAVNLTVLLLYAWYRLHDKIRPVHSVLIALGLILIVAAVLTHADQILTLFNRNTTLTGRVPMWQYLFTHVINQRPILGYGFGAIWSFDEFRRNLQSAVGWGYPVLIGDNGWVDILLHLGWAGIASMTVVLVQACVKSLQQIKESQTFIPYFPLVGLAFFLLANISLSMFLETEFFTWLILLIPFFVGGTAPGTDQLSG